MPARRPPPFPPKARFQPYCAVFGCQKKLPVPQAPATQPVGHASKHFAHASGHFACASGHFACASKQFACASKQFAYASKQFGYASKQFAHASRSGACASRQFAPASRSGGTTGPLAKPPRPPPAYRTTSTQPFCRPLPSAFRNR